MTGVITGTDSEPPAARLVVNGTVAGVTGGYDPVDGGWSFSSVLGPYLVDGANEIAAYEVTGSRAGRRAAPARADAEGMPAVVR